MLLPRIYELRDLIDNPNSPEAYFKNFENHLQDSPHHIRQIYMRWEKEFQTLDADGWGFLKDEASPYLVHTDRTGRGWQQLFDILNQARAYNYLRDVGCSEVRFIPRTPGLQTPDLEAIREPHRILCEVKTINISKDELRARTGLTARSIAIRLSDGFFRKLQSDIRTAKRQIQAYDPASEARCYVYINPCFDDFLAQCKADYFRQIDQYLSDNPISGVKLIFHNDYTAFYKPLAMTNAIVVNDGEGAEG